MVAEEVVVSLSGGAPWGFRLQGGAEQSKPLQVAKVRKRSKACRAGLREADELLAINELSCGELSHAQAMNLIDNGRGILHLRVRRSGAPGLQSLMLLGSSSAPHMDEAYRAALQALSPPLSSAPLRGGSGCITSPPDSEAYYGETDSDADVVAQERQRRQKRRSPSSSPAKPPPHEEEEEASEMSGYESAPDASGYMSQLQHRWAEMQGQPPPQQQQQQQQQQHGLPGVARREVVYQPPPTEWGLQEISGQNSGQSSPNNSQGAGEGDSGFQEAPAVKPPPLVSPERAREAMMLASRRQLVPMVGPLETPMDDELTATYKDKARQAKLHRGESGQEKQVKEARTKCRTIASLLTDAPNPHAKGVLMFKKRRQRAKKYTLTCFGSADDASLSRSETEDEEEEGSSFPGSESELEEEGFAASTEPDPIWDSGYLDLLDKRSSACIGEFDSVQESSPGLNMSGKGAQLFEQQRQRAAKPVAPPPVAAKPAAAPLSLMTDEQLAEMTAEMPPAPPAYAGPSVTVNSGMVNGDSTVVSRTSVVLAPAGHAVSMASGGPDTMDSQAGTNVHNRTAKPFAAGCVGNRAATAPVVFRPSPARKAVSVANMPAAFSSSSGPEVKRAVSSTSLYIPARPATVSGPPSAGASPLSPRTSVSVASFPPPAAHPAPHPAHQATYSAPHSAPHPAPRSAPHQATYSAPNSAPHPAPHPAPHQATYSAPNSAPRPAPHQATYSAPNSAPHPAPRSAPHQATYSAPHQATHQTPHSAPPAFSQAPGQPPSYNPPPPAMSQPYSPSSSMASAPFSPPAPHATPYSPQEAPAYYPPQSMPYSAPAPPPVPSKPYSSPHSQAAPFSPPPHQNMPLSPPHQPSAPFPPPSTMTMSYSQPPANVASTYPPAPVSAPYAPSQPVPASPPNLAPPPTAPKVSFNPYVDVSASPQPPAMASPQPCQAAGVGPEALASREQRIAVPAGKTGILQDARKRSSRKPMFSAPEEKKGLSPNPALLNMVQNLDERPRGDPGFESGPEEDSLNLGAEACNFMQIQRGGRHPPPPVAPKPSRAATGPPPPPSLQTGGKGAELFARRQSRMDRYVVDKQQPHPMSPAQPRDPSPTPSLPAHWKYSSSIRAPPPINYNPLLSPSCPLVAQRAPRASEAPRVAHKPGVKALDYMSRQPYQLNSSLFSYGGGVPQQPQGASLTTPRQVPVKAARVYEIKRFSTPTPMSAPTSLTPTVIVPRSATTLAEPIWRSEVASPPPRAPAPAPYTPTPTPYTQAPAPYSPAARPPPPSVTLPALPHFQGSAHGPAPAQAYGSHFQGSAHGPAPAQAYGSQFQAAKQFKSAPELSPLSVNPALRSSSTQPNLRVPRPRFSTSNAGLQPNVWRPGSMIH
ncbi:synaptopodin 2-like protein isoform X4 [Alosa sapidissima]|uniref:synaptopodin 2-like protein isoform X3 n=1 Tax=Alosa sapidissima TaxID=34773 RepID=UPI001C08DB2A|nr:synaptopodin 2-like protein isoform X3 [Alosa sapidissima]XP_041934849.1 synaptopodin 2-like protein isoform X4 [Alosa sapidissima]